MSDQSTTPKTTERWREKARSLVSLPQALNEAEAAKTLSEAGWDISERTLRRERDRGLISFRLIGGKVRYTEADLLDYLERGKRCEKAEGTQKTDSRSRGIGLDKRQEPSPGTTAGMTQQSARSVGALCMNAISNEQNSPLSGG